MTELLRYVLDSLAACVLLAGCAWLSHRPRFPPVALVVLLTCVTPWRGRRVVPAPPLARAA